jgi:hypothetical protein
MRKLLTTLSFVILFIVIKAQTKVFKEVSNEISSQFNAIIQDNNLVGYLAFTKLEKSNKDSFNYRITIMDENLNDIGTVNFKDQTLLLQSIAFEEDILCVTYIKSSYFSNVVSNKELKEIKKKENGTVVLQFIDLKGKIVKTNNYNITLDLGLNYANGTFNKVTIEQGNTKYPVQIYNVPQKGFACFFGDDNNKNVFLFDRVGKEIWKNTISEKGSSYKLHAGKNGVYLLYSRLNNQGREVQCYSLQNGSTINKVKLKDDNDNELQVTGLDNDPVSGDVYINGVIIDKDKTAYTSLRTKDVFHAPYLGYFTINIVGQQNNVTKNYSYLLDGNHENFITKSGKLIEAKVWPLIDGSFKDYAGNTYFVGSGLTKKPIWGIIVPSVILSPLVIPSAYLLGVFGTTKSRFEKGLIIKQSSNGIISLDNQLELNTSKYTARRVDARLFYNREYHLVSNSEKRINYLIADDYKNIIIYNIQEKKIVRKIPHKEGSNFIKIYPAKEGSIMVSEYNKKEKTTKLSIETL